MKVFKKYVKVVALCDENAILTPLYILWENSKRYKIDKILQRKKASSVVGGCGILYVCIIDGKKRKLFYEINRWFLESKIP